jgi:hypothetical protein
MIHGVFVYSESCPCIVCDQTFLCVHLAKRQCLGVLSQAITPLSKERSLQLSGTLHLPESITAMGNTIALIQGTDAGQKGEFFSVERWYTQGKIL